MLEFPQITKEKNILQQICVRTLRAASPLSTPPPPARCFQYFSCYLCMFNLSTAEYWQTGHCWHRALLSQQQGLGRGRLVGRERRAHPARLAGSPAPEARRPPSSRVTDRQRDSGTDVPPGSPCTESSCVSVNRKPPAGPPLGNLGKLSTFMKPALFLSLPW